MLPAGYLFFTLKRNFNPLTVKNFFVDRAAGKSIVSIHWN